MSEHTKGPWRQRITAALRSIEAQAFDGSWKYVVDRVNGGSRQESEANAHLIAAAPDMYEALKLAKILPRPWIDHAIGKGGTVTVDEWDAAWAQVDAAISKAEGR